MKGKKRLLILLTIPLLCSNIVLADSVIKNKDDYGIYFDDNMEYKDKKDFNEEEWISPEMEDMMNKVRGMKNSGAWSLDWDEVESKPNSGKEPGEEGKINLGSTDPGERVSDDAYEIAKSLGPIMFPIANYSGKMSSHFGRRIPPTKGASSYHKGMDIPCPTGTPLRAMMDGVISENGVYGNGAIYVAVAHKNGVTTRYLHLCKRSTLRIGQKVKQGDIIAYAGNTGVGTGPHLHLEVDVKGLKNGTYGTKVNPLFGFIDPNHVKASQCHYGGLDQNPKYNPNYRGSWIN